MKLALCIDPGHSPDTKATTGGKYSVITGMEEYYFNRAVADYLIDLCDKHGVDYIDVAPVGQDSPLYKRTKIANEYYKDISDNVHCVYVSIHANAGGGVGCEIWLHSRSLSSTINLGNSVLESICGVTGQKNRGIKKGFVTNPNADFHVNRETTMSSMLIEYGFMDNKLDCYKLLDEDFRKKCALSTLQGLANNYNIKLDLDDDMVREKPNRISPIVALDDDMDREKPDRISPIVEADDEKDELKAELEKYRTLYNKALGRAKQAEISLKQLKKDIRTLL